MSRKPDEAWKPVAPWWARLIARLLLLLPDRMLQPLARGKVTYKKPTDDRG